MSDPRAAVQPLIERLLEGDAAACARALSLVEGMDERSDAILAALFPRLGRAWRVGLAGPPGAGKSTLALQLARAWRVRGGRVGVVAVDPTSPLSGGALLGDRIRLGDLATDPGVFIRSLASRGSLGGLSLAAGRVADVLDAYGCDLILLETVGMGQVGDDVRQEADTAVVVLVPESGDGVQLMKAGILELADVLVVNKMDRPGGTDMLRRLAARDGRPRDAGATGGSGRTGGAGDAAAGAPWDPPVVGTVAPQGDGVDALAAAIDRHRAWLGGVAASPRADPAFWRRRLLRLAEQRLVRSWRARLASVADLDARLGAARDGRAPLDALLAELLAEFHAGERGRPGVPPSRPPEPPPTP